MKTDKKIGIWMDHQHAHLIEFTVDPMTTKIVESKSAHDVKRQNGENQVHDKEQHQQHDYYKKLGEVVKQYKEVVLFGPTSAKTEFFNSLSGNHQFSNIKIKIEDTDRMTENQEHAFVRNYFTTHKSFI